MEEFIEGTTGSWKTVSGAGDFYELQDEVSVTNGLN